ncbi:MAG: hypothetical protein LBR25_07645 [Erysipelotrichaceae bacterium]|nr:hypothetical protein [Erysipelotrichaceae bacterium]
MSETENEKILSSDLIATIMYKPKLSIVVCGLLGIALIAVWNIWTILIGVFFLAAAIFVYYVIKDFAVMEVRADGVVLLQNQNQPEQLVLPYTEINQWTNKQGNSGADAIEFLTNKGALYVTTFQIRKAYTALNKVIPEKEALAIQKEKNKNAKFKFRNPFAKKK